MKITQIGKIKSGQDGAIFGSHLFRFSSGGVCSVYDMTQLSGNGDRELLRFAAFELDKKEVIVPHSNAVCFGCDYYAEGDEYPLLYSNVYNNYAKEEDKRIGICCVYRIERRGTEFVSTLVQLIEIGFTEDSELWKASPEEHGARPYGNFVIDRDTRFYYAYVMRNEALGTRCFKFALPSPNEGEVVPKYGVKKVTLTPNDIIEFFDLPYHNCMQGAIFHKGKIYSTEGFTNREKYPPAIRVIDVVEKCETYTNIKELGYLIEPELIDFSGDVCYYGDAEGNLFTVDFDK